MNYERLVWWLIAWNVLLTVTLGFLLWQLDGLQDQVIVILKDLAGFFKDVKRNVHVVKSDVEKLGKAHNALASDFTKFLND